MTVTYYILKTYWALLDLSEVGQVGHVNGRHIGYTSIRQDDVFKSGQLYA